MTIPKWRDRTNDQAQSVRRLSAWDRPRSRHDLIGIVIAMGLALGLFANPGVAQPRTQLGLLVPINLTSISTNLGSPTGAVSGTTTRLGIGAFLERQLTRSLSLRIEASIVGRGGPLARGTEGESQLRSDYAEFPLLLTWKRASGPLRPFLRGGPVLAARGANGVGFDGSSTIVSLFPLKEHDFAVAGGFGAARSFGRFVSSVEIRGYHSITSVTDFGVTRNRSIGLITSLGYTM